MNLSHSGPAVTSQRPEPTAEEIARQLAPYTEAFEMMRQADRDAARLDAARQLPAPPADDSAGRPQFPPPAAEVLAT